MDFHKDFEIQGQGVPVNSSGRSQAVPNWIQTCKDNGVSNILMDAPNYRQRAACLLAESSSQNQLLLNGLVLLPSSQENGNSRLQSSFVPNHPCISAIDISANKDSVSQYNLACDTAATEPVVAPPTPADTGKNQYGKSKECILHENGNSRLQSCLVPNHLCKSAIDFSPTYDIVSQYNMASGMATTKTVVAPPTPVTMEKNKCGKLKEYILHEIIDLNSETSSNSLDQCVSSRVEPSQALTSQNNQTEADKVVYVDPSEGSQREKQDIDLNRTPPQKPRRKKHRPKVIVEGKVTKTPKKINLETAEKSRVKRKYVRKPKEDNPLQSPGKGKYPRKKKEVNPQPNPECLLGEQNVIDPNNFCRNQSVKRSLNFDLNDTQADESNTQVNEASEAVYDVLRTQISPATCSSTNYIANGSVRAPETPTQPQQLSRLELVKRRWREKFTGFGFNTKPRKEGEILNILDKEIDCTNIQRNKDKNMKDSQADLKGQKRNHNDVHDGWVHTNTSGTPCFHDIMKKRRTEYEQSKILYNSCSIPPHSPNSWRNVDNSQNSNKASMTADRRKMPNHILAVNYVTKDSTEIILSNNRLSCPGKSSIRDNHGCSQPSTSRVLPENVSYGPNARVEALIAHQTNAQTTKRRRKEKNRLVSSIAENTKRMELMVEYIVTKLTCLNINDVSENVIYEPNNALVPFVGGGMLVPFSGPLEVMKKKKPRAKVDLDDESQRVWNLLMGKESDGGEGTDADKEKWWENERQVFLGRTESFTARMHLIQGDRKFSPWKGSVVDSVIGVFLTQNVSDHLSSSAFMSLAAKFPIKSNSSNTASNVGTPARPIVTEPFFSDQNLPGVYDPNQQDNRELSCSTESSFSDRGVGHESPDSVLGSTITSCAITVEGEDDNIRSIEDVVSSPYSNSFTSFTQLLHMANNRALYAINVMDNKISDECGAGIDWPTLLRSNKVHIQDQSGSCPPKKPDLTNPEPLNNNKSKSKIKKSAGEKTTEYDWDSLRRQAFENGFSKERNCDTMDSLDYDALRNAHVSEISSAIRERGMNNLLAERIKAFLDRLARDHGSVDLEWLRHVSPDKAKDYLLSIRGLGLKSVECIRLLTLHQLAFPVDTNVARISVRLGWVPLQPLPESLQLHLLEMYPVMETIQKYLWPRLCKLDQKKLYELHYQLITFGKVFCTKSKPNCNACPMRGECKHFASAYASARLALPGPEEKRIVNSDIPLCSEERNAPIPNTLPFPQLMGPTDSQEIINNPRNSEPIIEEPSTPEPECVETTILDIEDDYYNDSDEIPTIKLNFEQFTQNLQNYMHENNMQLQDGNLSNALVALSPEAASIPAPKLKNVNRLRTEHQVYELPDGHPLLEGMDNREPDDPCKYLLAIWTPGETAQSTEAPKSCDSLESGKMCGMDTCFSCNSIREAQSQTVRGTILIPCRTANRGSFPLNGTYFQVNEVFADHDSSRFPIDVPREWLWNLNRRTVYFGTSIPSIFKGLTTEEIQYCFWRGFVCVRGFDRTTRAPKPLFARLHFPASKVTRTKRAAAAAAKTAEATSTVIAEQNSSVPVEKLQSSPIAEQNSSVPVEKLQSSPSHIISPQTNKNQSPITLIHID